MTKKTVRYEFVTGRFVFSAPTVAAPTLNPNSKNLAERLAAKATDAYARSAGGIDVTELSTSPNDIGAQCKFY
jgi:hypothetical protein